MKQTNELRCECRYSQSDKRREEKKKETKARSNYSTAEEALKLSRKLWYEMMPYCVPIKKTEYNKERDVTTFYTFSGLQYEMKGNHCVEEPKLKIVYEGTPIDKEVFSFDELKYVKNEPTSNLL